MSNAKKGFVLYFDSCPMLEALPPEQRGWLLSAVYSYADRIWREPSTELGEILDLYIAGKTVKDIVELTGLKETTVRFHNRNIYTKLGVHSLKQLLRFCTILQQEEGNRGRAKTTE